MGLPDIPIPNQFYDGDKYVKSEVTNSRPRVAALADILEWPDPRFEGDLLVVTGDETNGIYAALDDGDGALEWTAIVAATDE